MSEQEQTARVFKAFCDAKRIAILQLLGTGELCACQLMEQLGIAQSALSYHMKILCEAGVVESRSVGKWTHYQISAAGSAQALALLADLTRVAPQEGGTKCRRACHE